MNTAFKFIIAIALGSLPLLAQAGSNPAGPIGGGSTTVGGILGASRGVDASLQLGSLGFGAVIVNLAQALQFAQALQGVPGAQSNAAGTYLTAQITLDNGVTAIVTVNTETGQVTVSQVE